MILLDTTVLVYAVGTEHELRLPCRRILHAHGAGTIQASTTVDVIQEFVHVRARRRNRADAAVLGRHYLSALTILPTGSDDLERGLSLFVDFPRIGSFDALLAAVALNHRVQALVRADRAFGTVTGLPWINPASSALNGLLGENV